MTRRVTSPGSVLENKIPQIPDMGEDKYLVLYIDSDTFSWCGKIKIYLRLHYKILIL